MMKLCGQKLVIPVNGRERTLSEQELITILEKHYNEGVSTAKVAKVPIEDQWFEVNPLGIDQEIFQKKRKDAKQEATRQLILEAFVELKKNPEKYGKKFKTMIPKKDWTYKTVTGLKKMACDLGDHMADWVEQSLEWAQRIANGESWETICNEPDIANCYRAVVWKNEYVQLIGGSVYYGDYDSASRVSHYGYLNSSTLIYTVPLVVLYKK